MKKNLLGIIAVMFLVLLYTGCSGGNTNEQKDYNNITSKPQETGQPQETSKPQETGQPQEARKPLKAGDQYAYTTISEWFDWGPAITKVIFNLGVQVDQSTLTPDAFKVSSVRGYNMDGSPPDSREKTAFVETAERKILKVYSSDETGKSQASSTYITFELEVKAGVTDSSPLNYKNGNGMSNWVDTSYIIELAPDSELKAADGTQVTFQPTGKAEYVGNKNMIPDGFDYSGSYNQDNIQLLYASFTPKTASPKKGANPLLIWLHGHGEGGKDPSLTVVSNQVVKMADKEIQSFFGDTGCYLLFPQAPTFWMDYNGNFVYNNGVEDSQGKSYYSEALMGLIKNYVAAHPEIDPDRIYIGGFSNGGYMTLNMITLYPDYFAAALPVCEGYKNEWLTEDKLKSIVDIPIWFTHAKNDSEFRVYEIKYNEDQTNFETKKDENGKEIPIYDYSSAAYDRLKKAGAKNVHYSLWDKVVNTTGEFFKEGTNEPYEYYGHFSWMYVYNNLCKDTIDGREVTIFEWLSRQKR